MFYWGVKLSVTLGCDIGGVTLAWGCDIVGVTLGCNIECDVGDCDIGDVALGCDIWV